MVYFDLAPADDLAAVYDPKDQVLKLSVRGNVPHYMYDFCFERVPWYGGLKFELCAWSDPRILGSSFEYSEDFDMPNLRPVDPEGSVIIVSSNFRDGHIVPIRWLGLSPIEKTPSNVFDAYSKLVVKPDDTVEFKPRIMDATPINLTIIFGHEFTIQESFHNAHEGFIHIKHSPSTLSLIDSGLELGHITWTFNPLETGTTQIILTMSPGPYGGVITRKIYNIRVIVLDNAQTSDDTVTDSLTGSESGGILSFRGRVFIAQRIVQREVPDAQLVLCKARLPGVRYPVTDPLRLSQLECTFTTNEVSVSIKSRGWGNFDPPVIKPHPIIGLVGFGIEEDTKVDIVGAVDAMYSHFGKRESFFSADLSRPMFAPGERTEEPYYQFRLADGPIVFVGTVDKQIFINNAGEEILPKKVENAVENSSGSQNGAL